MPPNTLPPGAKNRDGSKKVLVGTAIGSPNPVLWKRLFKRTKSSRIRVWPILSAAVEKQLIICVLILGSYSVKNPSCSNKSPVLFLCNKKDNFNLGYACLWFATAHDGKKFYLMVQLIAKTCCDRKQLMGEAMSWNVSPRKHWVGPPLSDHWFSSSLLLVNRIIPGVVCGKTGHFIQRAISTYRANLHIAVALRPTMPQSTVSLVPLGDGLLGQSGSLQSLVCQQS